MLDVLVASGPIAIRSWKRSPSGEQRAPCRLDGAPVEGEPRGFHGSGSDLLAESHHRRPRISRVQCGQP